MTRLIELIDKWHYHISEVAAMTIDGTDEQYGAAVARRMEAYAQIKAYAEEYEALKYCYSPNEVFARTCACKKEEL
jgi:hypothetical protein